MRTAFCNENSRPFSGHSGGWDCKKPKKIAHFVEGLADTLPHSALSQWVMAKY
jgi:hypothetical protein